MNDIRIGCVNTGQLGSSKQIAQIVVAALFERILAERCSRKQLGIHGADGLRMLRIRLHANRRLSQVPKRSEEHTSELQSLMRISYAVFSFKKLKYYKQRNNEVISSYGGESYYEVYNIPLIFI